MEVDMAVEVDTAVAADRILDLDPTPDPDRILDRVPAPIPARGLTLAPATSTMILSRCTAAPTHGRIGATRFSCAQSITGTGTVCMP